MAMVFEAWEEALPVARRALATSERIDDRRLIANSQNLVGTLLWHMGDSTEGERYKRAAVETMRSTGDRLGGAMFIAQMGEHLMDQGDFAGAERLILEALPAIREQRPDAASLFQGSLVRIALERGNLDEAGEILEAALAYHLDPPHRQPVTLTDRFCNVAQLAARRGRAADGARLVGASLTILERTGMIDHSQARKLLAETDAELARAIDASTLQRQVAIGRRMTVPEAIQLALEIARLRPEPVAAPAAPDDGLTERQREILRLLAAGKSNSAIAEELFISERTVTTHLTRIYDRLDVATRTEAVARAAQLGIQPERQG
jgi:ATP/maltotriose-dependent transcriptional regulator MalT